MLYCSSPYSLWLGELQSNELSHKVYDLWTSRKHEELMSRSWEVNCGWIAHLWVFFNFNPFQYSPTWSPLFLLGFFLVYSCLFCIPDELNHDAKISLRGSFTNNYWTKINTATGSSFTDKKNSFWQDMLHMCEQKSVISLWELIHLCDFLSQASFNFPLDCKVWFSMAPDFKWY